MSPYRDPPMAPDPRHEAETQFIRQKARLVDEIRAHMEQARVFARFNGGTDTKAIRALTEMYEAVVR